MIKLFFLSSIFTLFVKLIFPFLILYSIISDFISKFISIFEILPCFTIIKDLSLKYFIFTPSIIIPSSLIFAIPLFAIVKF